MDKKLFVTTSKAELERCFPVMLELLVWPRKSGHGIMCSAQYLI